ncbi:MAG: inosine/xanthosine triphosphatase [Minisyncoccota bacterium]
MKMKIGVGSKNKTKVGAVADILKDYPMFEGAEVVGVDVNIEQFGHPKNIEETVAGAVDRAKQAYVENDFGFGIESGLMKVPQTKSGYMEVAVCTIYDGRQIHMGLSQAYEWPKKVLDAILNDGLDGSQAMKAAGLTQQEKLGENEGFVGLFTKGRTNRTEYNKAAVVMALMHLENPEHF